MRIFPILGWMLIPGCWAVTGPGMVTGPGTVTGPAGGSVSVRCSYGRIYERFPKFWCRAGPLFCAEDHIAESSGSEAEVKRGRVSLRDNHTLSSFTVTVRNLTPADAGTYWCGIAKDWQLDLTQAVQVIVSPAIQTSDPTRRPPATAEQPGNAASTPITISISRNDTHALAQLSNIHFLLLALWKVPILLCIIRVNVWYRKTCREMPGRHSESLQIPTLSSSSEHSIDPQPEPTWICGNGILLKVSMDPEHTPE